MMKTYILSFSLSLLKSPAFPVLLVLFFMFGCAHEKQEDFFNKGTTNRAQKQTRTYEFTTRYVSINKVGTIVKPSVAGSISFDFAENSLRWNEKTLHLIKLQPPTFFDGSGLIRISGKSSDGKNGVAVVRDYRGGGTAHMTDVCETKPGCWNDFNSDFNRIDFPTNYHGLVATIQYVDGTPVEINYYKLIGFIQCIEKECLLNGKPAQVHRTTAVNGNGLLSITNESGNLLLRADGLWRFAEQNNSGKEYAGDDESLKRIYLTLREYSQ
jgi:hypothetical protein